MMKKGLGLGLAFLLVCFAAFAEEEFTITTYYPSPYGSYNELEVYRSVTYKPVNKDAITDPKEGELVYDSTKDQLYLYNGSKWVAQAGGSASYVAYGTTNCAEGWTRAYSGYATLPASYAQYGIPTSVGSVFCAQEDLPVWTGCPMQLVWIQSYSNVHYSKRISCAVCVK